MAGREAKAQMKLKASPWTIARWRNKLILNWFLLAVTPEI